MSLLFSLLGGSEMATFPILQMIPPIHPPKKAPNDDPPKKRRGRLSLFALSTSEAPSPSTAAGGGEGNNEGEREGLHPQQSLLHPILSPPPLPSTILVLFYGGPKFPARVTSSSSSATKMGTFCSPSPFSPRRLRSPPFPFSLPAPQFTFSGNPIGV